MLVECAVGGEEKCVSLCFGLCGDASALVPPFLGGDLWSLAGQVSDYLRSLPSNRGANGKGFQVESAIYSALWSDRAILISQAS